MTTLANPYGTAFIADRILTACKLNPETIARIGADDCQSLDAPDWIPAGGCYAVSTPDGYYDGKAFQFTTLRGGWRQA